MYESLIAPFEPASVATLDQDADRVVASLNERLDRLACGLARAGEDPALDRTGLGVNEEAPTKRLLAATGSSTAEADGDATVLAGCSRFLPVHTGLSAGLGAASGLYAGGVVGCDRDLRRCALCKNQG